MDSDCMNNGYNFNSITYAIVLRKQYFQNVHWNIPKVVSNLLMSIYPITLKTELLQNFKKISTHQMNT